MKKILSILLSLTIIASATCIALAITPADGNYSAEAWWEGGTGRAAIVSPSSVTVSGGNITAKIVLTSSNYTWMETQGQHFNNENPGGNSTFTIPVPAFDTPFDVSAETTAMSEPHVIDYKITVSSSGIPEFKETAPEQVPDKESDKAPEEIKNDNKVSETTPAKPDNDSEKADDSGKKTEDKKKKETVKKNTSEKDTIVKENRYSTSTSLSMKELKACNCRELHIETSKGMTSISRETVDYLIKNAKGGITLVLKEDKADDSELLKSYTFMIKDYEENNLLKDGLPGDEVINISIPVELAEKNIIVNMKSDKGIEPLEYVYDENVLKVETSISGQIKIEKEVSSAGYILAGIALAAVIAAIALFIRKKGSR